VRALWSNDAVSRHGRAALLVSAAVGFSVACTRGPSDTRSANLAVAGARGANLLLVTIDTLRRDRLGAYGSTARLTPVIDQLAGRGVRFERAYAHSPMTLPSHASILTGRTPVGHGLRNNGTYRLDAGVPTLATALASHGYRRGAFVGAFVLDARYGLGRGFEVYDDRLPGHRGQTTFRYAERSAAEVVQAAGDWITSGASGPWFAWVHLFDPHAPYAAPPEFAAGRAAYDGEVAYADAMVGRLLTRLAAAGLANRTLIVVTADHGESLGEHGESTHGLFAYDETINVPLVVAGPGVTSGVVRAAVGHADVAPTVLDLLGAPALEGVSGHSLVTTPAADREVYFEAMDAALSRGWAPLTGVVTARWKLIDLPERELYDLVADAAEAKNLAMHDPATADGLDRRRRAALAVPSASAPAASRDADGDRRLRALGYVASAGAVPAGGPPRPGLDPKRLVAVHEQFTAALEAFSSGHQDVALREFQAVLREHPAFTVARTSAASVLVERGRAREAVVLLDAAPAETRQTPELLAKLGVARREAGDLQGARTALEAVRASGWQNPEVLNDLGVVYARLGRTDEARAAFSSLLETAPHAADVWNNLGVLELSAGRAAEAAAAFRHAVDTDPAFGDAWQGLGAALIERDPAGAIEAWRRAERLLPQDFDLLYNLGMLLAAGERPAEAAPYLARFLEEAPPVKYARDRPTVASTLRRVSP
jgi:arylsulfatase A-like enzyme/Flp pilus assembly protein TadD